MYEHAPVLTRPRVRIQIWCERNSLFAANKKGRQPHLVYYVAMRRAVGNMVAPPHVLPAVTKLMYSNIRL
jgi:hypothetical protein